MTLRTALLSLLASGPMTGYDLSRRFASSVGFVWQASDSQIYPELRKMEREGLLDTAEVPWGSKGATKTEYSLNTTGRASLAERQQEPVSYPSERDPARLRAAYLEWGTPESARRFLKNHQVHFEQLRTRSELMIEELESRTHQTLSRRLENSEPAEHDRIVAFKVFAYRGHIARANTEIAWAQEGIKLLENLDW
ncbi:PadR family transcriptional regulator [Corynebacterium sp. A21]|uniref:PadR family transcriptional regulator n=1 Tax=Corynebacterium sp. A21 TaxID=3457318 RepID=UPI003FD0764B